MTKTEILIKRLRCEARYNCSYESGVCPSNCPCLLPEELQDYDPRAITGEAADKIEELIVQVEELKANASGSIVNGGIYFGAPISTKAECTFTKSECANIVDFLELNLFDIIRKDDEIDNLEWLRSMLSIHSKAMHVIGKKWNDEKECWEAAQ